MSTRSVLPPALVAPAQPHRPRADRPTPLSPNSLDRLISLLEVGSTPAVKQTAARQLGQIAGRSFGSSSSAASAADRTLVGHGLESEAEWTEVLGLVGRVLPHLKSKSYDTRSAAALALEQIARSVPLWSPPALAPGGVEEKEEEEKGQDEPSSSSSKPASLALVDLPALIAPDRPKLLASSGKEYALAAGPATDGSGPLSAAELKRSKDEVMRRMGIALPGGLDDGIGAFVDDEMAAEESAAAAAADSPSTAAAAGLTTLLPGTASPTLPPATAEAVSAQPPPATPTVAPPRGKRQREQFEREEERRQREAEDEAFHGLSARQINALKRKRKASGGAAVVPSFGSNGKAPRLESPLSAAPSPAPSPAGSPRASSSASALSAAVVIDPQAKAAVVAAAAADAAAAGGAVDPTTGKADWTTHLVVPRSHTGGERWPFEKVVDQLLVGLFAPAWEVRHGACLGLRELVKLHGASAGRTVGLDSPSNDRANAERLLGLAHAILTLLALDRFGDFNADQLVAPVRETAGQALASVLVHLPARHVGQVHAVLVGMVRQDWLGPTHAGGGAAAAKEGTRARGYAWEVRHAGLLGLKYEVAVRPDLFDSNASTAATVMAAATIASSAIKVEATASDGLAIKSEPYPATGFEVKPEADAEQLPGLGLTGQNERSTNLLRDVVDAAVLG